MTYHDFQRLLKASLVVGASVSTLAIAWAQFGGEPADDGAAIPATAPVQWQWTPFAAPPTVEAGPAEPPRRLDEQVPTDLIAAPAATSAARPNIDDKPAGEPVPADTRTPEEQVSQPGGSC